MMDGDLERKLAGRADQISKNIDRALARRNGEPEAKEFTTVTFAGVLLFTAATRTVRNQQTGIEVVLKSREYKFLQMLADHFGQPVEKAALYYGVRGEETTDKRALERVDGFASRLNQKLRSTYASQLYSGPIENRRYKGYYIN